MTNRAEVGVAAKTGAGNRSVYLLALIVIAAFAVFLAGCASMGHTVTRRAAPPFKVSLVSGGEATLEQFSGKPLVLVIGASWCPHCLHELPDLVRFHEKYGERVGLLMVFIKSEPGEVKDLVTEHDLKFMVAQDEQAEIAKPYEVKGMPVTFFIDPGGTIVDEYLGGITLDRLTERVDSMLSPAQPAK